MDQREHQVQSLGICNRLYNFIMKSLARQAFKNVIIGRPMPPSLAQASISDAAQNTASSKSDQMVLPTAQEQVNTSKNSDEQEKDSKEAPQVQDIGADIISSASNVDEKNDLFDKPGTRPEEEAPLPANALQAKAPKKIVSINERVEEIYTSKKKDKKKKKETEKLTSMERKDDEPKPLKSILKVGSDLNEKLDRQ